MNKKNVAFIGLGVMGFPMAGHLKNNNFNVSFEEFSGGHKISINYLKKIQSIINE